MSQRKYCRFWWKLVRKKIFLISYYWYTDVTKSTDMITDYIKRFYNMTMMLLFKLYFIIFHLYTTWIALNNNKVWLSIAKCKGDNINCTYCSVCVHLSYLPIYIFGPFFFYSVLGHIFCESDFELIFINITQVITCDLHYNNYVGCM